VYGFITKYLKKKHNYWYVLWRIVETINTVRLFSVNGSLTYSYT